MLYFVDVLCLKTMTLSKPSKYIKSITVKCLKKKEIRVLVRIDM